MAVQTIHDRHPPTKVDYCSFNILDSAGVTRNSRARSNVIGSQRHDSAHLPLMDNAYSQFRECSSNTLDTADGTKKIKVRVTVSKVKAYMVKIR